MAKIDKVVKNDINTRTVAIGHKSSLDVSRFPYNSAYFQLYVQCQPQTDEYVVLILKKDSLTSGEKIVNFEQRDSNRYYYLTINSVGMWVMWKFEISSQAECPTADSVSV